MQRKTRILIVEDEVAIRNGLIDVFLYHGYEVDTAADGKTGLEKALGGSFDLILLDVMLPGMDGFELCNRLRAADPEQPIIMLTAKSGDEEIIRGLSLGADDYVKKPFSQRLLIERIKAVLRRRQAGATPTAEEEKKVIRRGELTLDPLRHACAWKGKHVTLTVTEFLILEALAQRPGYVKSRDQLMDAAYDDQVYVDDRTIDSHIKRIRKKFRVVDREFDAIETLYGVGYKYNDG